MLRGSCLLSLPCKRPLGCGTARIDEMWSMAEHFSIQCRCDCTYILPVELLIHLLLMLIHHSLQVRKEKKKKHGVQGRKSTAEASEVSTFGH